MNSSTTTTSMPTTAEFKAALDGKLNLVVTKNPGEGIVNRTLAEIKSLSDKVVVTNPVELNYLCASDLDPAVEVIVVNEAHRALPLALKQVGELMLNRSIDGESLPQLKSVVVFLTGHQPETKRIARQLADLAPTLNINIG